MQSYNSYSCSSCYMRVIGNVTYYLVVVHLFRYNIPNLKNKNGAFGSIITIDGFILKIVIPISVSTFYATFIALSFNKWYDLDCYNINLGEYTHFLLLVIDLYWKNLGNMYMYQCSRIWFALNLPHDTYILLVILLIN